VAARNGYERRRVLRERNGAKEPKAEKENRAGQAGQEQQ
jgi:hypothetical protein